MFLTCRSLLIVISVYFAARNLYLAAKGTEYCHLYGVDSFVKS
jgi:hypothetical protein